MINDNKVFQSIHYPLPTKKCSTAPIIIMNSEIISKTMMVLQEKNPLPPPPPPPPMVVSPTASPLWLKKPPTKKLRCTSTNTNNNKRRVYFGNDVTLAYKYIESSCEITKEEKDSRWYQSIELESFKQSARSLCRERILRNKNIKENNSSNSNEDEDENSNSSDSSQSQNQNDQTNQVELLEENNNAADSEIEIEIKIVDSLRGMGVYYPSRVRYCKKYIKHVLVAYHVKCGPTNKENVAYLATKWSSKNQQRAVETGRNDYCAAYDISMPQKETQANVE